MGNASRHGRHSDSNTRRMVEKMHQGLFASPAQAAKPSPKAGNKKQSGAKSADKPTKQKMKNDSSSVSGNATKTAGSSPKKRRKKKNRPTSTEPRKGRKESFTKYIPGYVPTVPIDEGLGGVYDAVEHEDPHHGYYDGKSFIPIDDSLSALCDVAEDKPDDPPPQHLRSPRPFAAAASQMPARPMQNPASSQSYQERRYYSDTTSTHKYDKYYNGTYDYIYNYDNLDTDGQSGDNDTNTGACDGVGDNSGGSYDSGLSYDAGGSYDSGPSYDAGGSYDTGGGCDGGGSSSCD